MTRLVEAVERAKIALSDRQDVRLFDPFLAGEGADAAHLDLELTRADVNEAARALSERTLGHIDTALRDAKVRASDLESHPPRGRRQQDAHRARHGGAHLQRPAHLDLDAEPRRRHRRLDARRAALPALQSPRCWSTSPRTRSPPAPAPS